MSITELGALGEFIGSIAVLVTLIYLAYQTRQNTTMLQQSRDAQTASMAQAKRVLEPMLHQNVALFMSSPSSRRWWDSGRLIFGPDVVKLIDVALSQERVADIP